MKSRMIVVVLAGSLPVLAVACRDRSADRTDLGTNVEPSPKTGEATLTGANVVSNQSAIDRIVAARCERAAACNEVGAGKDYATRDACTRDVRSSMRDDLKASDCPHGIDQKELNECLTEIRNEDCKNPIDSLERVVACRTSDLCQSTSMPNQ